MEDDVERMCDKMPEQMTIKEIVDYYINHELAHNGLLVTIDYLEFTVFVDKDEKAASIDGRETEVISDILQIDPAEFIPIPGGTNGYPKRLKWMAASIFVLYGAGPRQGVHVIMGGNACRMYTSKVGELELLLLRINGVRGKLTRIDLAVDDLLTKYYSVEDVIKCYDRQEIVSRWRTIERQLKNDIRTKIGVKTCVYFGSIKSDCYLRVYNKTIEQMNREQRKLEEIAAVEEVWTRWEIVLRRDTAQGVVRLILEHMPLGTIWSGIMSNYFRLVVRGEDSNYRRWQAQEKWVQFVGAAEPLRLKMYPAKRDITTLKSWVEHQIAPSLAAIVEAEGAKGLEWIVKETLAADRRISPYYRSIINEIGKNEKPKE